jgi:hypothetical protein
MKADAFSQADLLERLGKELLLGLGLMLQRVLQRTALRVQKLIEQCCFHVSPPSFRMGVTCLVIPGEQRATCGPEGATHRTNGAPWGNCEKTRHFLQAIRVAPRRAKGLKVARCLGLETRKEGKATKPLKK